MDACGVAPLAVVFLRSRSLVAMARLLGCVVALGLLLAASAVTDSDQTAALLAFKAKMLPLGPNWAYALQARAWRRGAPR